jgi:hypothetical protein
MGGISHGRAGWVWLFLVLWPLPSLGWAAIRAAAMIEAQVQRARLARVSEAEAKICSERSRAKRRRTHDHPDQPRKATREAMTDVEIIAQILQALGEGPDGIDPAVVYWLGKRLNAADPAA